MNYFAKLMSTVFVLTLLNGCSHWGTNNEHTAMCKELNSKIMFSGNTSNIRAAEIARSETALTRRTYENNCE